MTALSELTVDDVRERENALDRSVGFLLRERDKVRAELARRAERPVSELFPRPARRSTHQRAWVDADRARVEAERELDRLRAFIAECPRCSVAVAA